MFAFRYKPIDFFFVFSCIQLFLGIKGIATASQVFHNCSGGVYYQNSTFATNLDQLISSLTSKAANQSFFNFTVGEEPDRIYGLFQCRGDINLEQCKSCLQTSSTEIKQTCPNTTQGVVWYDFCLVQYSDQNFFGLIQTDGFNFYNDKFSDKPYGQPDKALEFVTNLLQQVPSRPLMFATAASPPDEIYSLVQCTMDVSKDGCRKCLQAVFQGIKECCSWKRGWRYFAPSCSVRYEAYLFFNGTKVGEELERPYCPNDVSAANLVFNTNLNQLLRTLTTNAPASGFYSSSFGHDPDLVYGLVLCRGDLDLTSCQECLNSALNDLTEACPNKTQVILWYRRCQLRYSNESFFGTADTEGFSIASHVDDNIGNQSLEVMDRLVKTASKEKLMFASDELRVNESERRYYYAQCTRDLNSSTCHDCLKELIQEVMKCCINKKGWTYLAASCNMRYEAYVFLNTNEVVAPATQPNPSPQLIPATSPIPAKGFVPGNVSKEGKKAKNSRVLAIGITVAFLGFVLLGCCIFYLLRGRKKPKIERKQQQSQDTLLDNLGPPTGTDLLNTNISGGSQMETQELPLISLDTILHATNKFSFENKLGEGGFGAVYKGILADGKEIAVKRLSKGSSQGLMEFKNEVILIAKLQHKNLVRLLFCCIEKGEKLLVYEYMPNTSLDVFLFDQVKRAELHWRIRLNIVTGIARGLLYLHEDSRLKVIHRDLKASNVLLDHEMNPKISDFGLARTFEENQGEANTKKVIGTYGYMAPEYAMDGLFSVKSDVFSFGVLLLEILSGRRNNRAHLVQNDQSLLAYAWQLWCDEKVMELIDPMLIDSSPMDHVLRFLHIGLLCIQEVASQRPTMSSVVLMLGSESMILPQPSQPPLYLGKRGLAPELSHSNARTPSSNEVTISEVEPR